MNKGPGFRIAALVFAPVCLALLMGGGMVAAQDCGCVGATQTFGWGDTITESCTLNCNLDSVSDGTCFTIGTDNITIDGGGFTISGDDYYYGIDVAGRNNVVISNFGISAFSTGINVSDSYYIEISDNVISDNVWWSGIVIVRGGHCTIDGNTLIRNGNGTNGRGILVGASSDNLISDNILDESGKGIFINSGAHDNTISGNRVTNSDSDGIHVDGGASGNILNSNTICASGGYDISDAGSANAGDDNICDTTDGYNDTGTTGCTFDCTPPWIHDYNGDGTSDIAVFRGSSGMWSIRDLTRVYLGLSSDDLVPDDYNGDGTTDTAIFRVSSGMWSVRDITRFYLGGAGDQPVPGDYRGDGTAEGGIFRPPLSLWSIRNVTRTYLGVTGDTAIPGYYDGDETKDIAVFRGTSGMWSVLNLTRFYFGSSDDRLVPGDYAGPREWEGGIFRESTGLWSIRNVTRIYLGSANDWALPADYNGNGVDEAGIFRDSTGLWSVRDLTRVYFGATDDIPVTR
jgi:parallel beta-helix repeat protein